jgi:hypothetical protein
MCSGVTRRVWRYQRGNQNPYIEDEHTTQWPKENVQKDKQRSKIAPFSIQSTSLDKIYTSGSQCTFYWNIRIQNEEICSSNMSSDGIDDNLAF